MITQGRSQAIPSRRSQPVAHPNDARNFEQATLAAAATTTINGVRSTSIPLPNFGDPTTPVRQQRFGFKHDDHTDWRIRLPFTEFIIHLWWLKWSEEEGKSLQTRDGNVMMLYMTGWSQLPKDYGWEESKFFSPGRVFAIPWPTKPEKCLSDDVSEVQKLTEQYFVVIRSDETGHFTLPISSYNGQGVQNLGAVAWEHGDLYTQLSMPRNLYQASWPDPANGTSTNSSRLKLPIEVRAPADLESQLWRELLHRKCTSTQDREGS